MKLILSSFSTTSRLFLKRSAFVVYAIGLSFCIAFTPPLYAAIDLSVTQGTFRPIPLLVVLSGPSDLARSLTSTVSGDLGGCGVFKPIAQHFMPQTPSAAFSTPQWQAWQQTGGEILVAGTIEENSGKVSIQFRVFDVLNGRELTALSLTGKREQIRRIAHQVADTIYARVTGHGGYFDTQIAYISGKGSGLQKKFTLQRVDQDGANPHIITQVDAHLVKAPQFSSDGKKLLYIANKERLNPHAFVYDLRTGREERIMVKGRVFSAHFVPNSTAVILSLTDGEASIGKYTDGSFMSLVGKKKRRDSGMDTSPACSPDGNQYVFVSDRGSRPQLYTMPCTGGKAERISYNVGSCFSPAWSPKGDLIAFVRRDGGFFLSTLNVSTGETHTLASFYLVDSPSWAPNGHALVFSAKESAFHPSQIYVLDMTSLKIRKLHTSGDVSEPTWSPLL